ncbi:MerR family transcriptional regulator [Streptomyces sp. NPDC056528]
MTPMRISRLAERSGMPATTLRFYEDKASPARWSVWRGWP